MSIQTSSGLEPAPRILGNGLRALAVHTTTTPAVSISVVVEAGSRHDPVSCPGAAYFVSRVIDRGTVSQTAEAISTALDDRGVSLRVTVTRQLLSISADCLVEDFEGVLDLLADILRHPVFPETEVEIRRGEVLTALKQDEDSPASTALDRLMPLLYGADHPFGRRTKGTTDSVTSMGRGALMAFHARRFSPAGASVVVVGDLETAAALDAVSGAFGDWRGDNGDAEPLLSPPAATERRRVVVPMMNKAQADIAYGFTTIPRVDPAYYAYWLLANIFGQYGLGGRLGHSIRQRQGMAYYAFCGFEAGVIPGPLIVRAGVSAENVDRAVASIDTEVSSLAEGGVTAEELSDSKQYLIGSLPRTLETNSGIAAFLQNVQQFELGLDYDRRLPPLLAGVTQEDVAAAARQTLDPERAAMVIAGPYEDTTPSSPDL